MMMGEDPGRRKRNINVSISCHVSLRRKVEIRKISCQSKRGGRRRRNSKCGTSKLGEGCPTGNQIKHD